MKELNENRAFVVYQSDYDTFEQYEMENTFEKK